jgi:thymidylate synthase (FAD)
MQEIKCLNHGFVKLIDVMGDDSAIVQAARVSYGDGTKTITKDRGLIRYLLRHEHTSPLEMVEFKFHCKMPMFIARQWIRHRTANVNEVSGRYSVLPDEKYIPEKEDISFQSTDNKQGRSEAEVSAKVVSQTLDTLQDSYDNASAAYNSLLEMNVAREISRICLPLSQYTEWYWKIDLHNLLHFLKLRLHHHAQKEIRVFAEAIRDIIKPIVPLTWEAFEDYVLDAHRFSGPELEVLKKLLKENKIDFPSEHPKISQRELKELNSVLKDD